MCFSRCFVRIAYRLWRCLVTEGGVRKSLKDMYTTKASSPNSFHTMFYKKFWNVVGSDICQMVLGFLNGDTNSGDLNETFLILMPKKVFEFRLIRICIMSATS